MSEDLPARIGAYPIRGLIGTGSMGMVFLGHDPVIDRPVAIKTIHTRLLEAAGAEHNVAARFRVEAQSAGRLNHRNIVAVYQFGQQNDGGNDDSAYIVMEYVAGHSLRDYLKRDRFSKPEVMCLMSQLLEALHFAHERGVVHRDIKPANLIVAEDGRMKISDFGIGRTESSQITRVNAVVGSPGYIAPEQYTGGAQDRRVDVFAAGVLLYQLLTGSMPFSGTDESIMYQIVYEQHQPLVLRSGDPSLAAYEPILDGALAKDPSQRFASAKAFLEALQAISREPVADVLARHRLLPPRAPLALTTPLATALTAAPAGNAAPAPSGGSGGPGAAGRASSPGPNAVSSAVSSAASSPGSSPGSNPAGASSPSHPSNPSHPSVPVPTGWDETALLGLERELARHVGPVARVLVRRAARGHTELSQVRQAVAGSITDFTARERFLSAASGTSPGTGPRTGPRSGTSFGSGFADTRAATQLDGPALRPDDVDKAAVALSRMLGPIAKVVARQCAAKSTTREQFVARVLEQLAPGVDAKTVQAELWRVLT